MAWGPMFYADAVGLKHIVERISTFDREMGARWKVSPPLRKLAESGKTFRTFDKERSSSIA